MPSINDRLPSQTRSGTGLECFGVGEAAPIVAGFAGDAVQGSATRTYGNFARTTHLDKPAPLHLVPFQTQPHHAHKRLLSRRRSRRYVSCASMSVAIRDAAGQPTTAAEGLRLGAPRALLLLGWGLLAGIVYFVIVTAITGGFSSAASVIGTIVREILLIPAGVVAATVIVVTYAELRFHEQGVKTATLVGELAR
jgi:hypothetical protein